MKLETDILETLTEASSDSVWKLALQFYADIKHRSGGHEVSFGPVEAKLMSQLVQVAGKLAMFEMEFKLHAERHAHDTSRTVTRQRMPGGTGGGYN